MGRLFLLEQPLTLNQPNKKRTAFYRAILFYWIL